MGKYSEDPAWADVEPIPQNEGSEHPLAAIAYSEGYAEAMGYLRAIMAKNEMSERALALTKDIIDFNPAHYTIWLFRARVLFALEKDLKAEITWLNETALKHPKNYQIWHHRQMVINRLGACDGERVFIAKMFENDAKNYHVWSYRQWLVRRFELWDDGELNYIDSLLEEDVRNNSAWNHRFFIVFGRGEAEKDEAVAQREIAYAEAAISVAPQNESPWNYLRGVISRCHYPLAEIRPFVEKFASLEHADDVRSTFALDTLADIYALQSETHLQASHALNLLAEKYDPIRANYWKYRQSLLSPPVA